MKRHVFSLKTSAIAFAYMLAGLSPSYGDDIDIYTGSSILGTKRPNIMLIIDTSGSMSENVTYEDANGVTIDTQKQRIAHVKDATKAWLATAENVNVGLMRFSNPGGPVLYPITYIDQPLNSKGDITTVSRRVAIGTDDGFEFTTSKKVVLDRPVLQIADNLPTSAVITLPSITISNINDDSEETVSNGSILLTGSSLDTPSEGSNRQALGLRFTGINIPQGATINSATMEFIVRATPDTSGPLTAIIQGQKGNDAPTFNGTAYNTSSRINVTNGTTATQPWNDDDVVDVGDKITTDNFANVVQEIVNDGAWRATNNSMVFVVKQDPAFNTFNNRKFYASNATSASNRPKLNISYQTGALGTDSSLVGLRFADLSLPRGVQIESAKIRFTNSTANTPNAGAYTIKGEKTGDSAAFTTTDNNLSSRVKTTTSTAWNPADWLTPDTTEDSADIKAIVQEIVDQSSWCGGNALSLFIEGNGERFAKAFEGSSSQAPLLEITYKTSSITAGSSCRKQQFVRQVNNSADDAEESGTTTKLDSPDLELLVDSSTQDVGIRFNNIKLPKNATVKNAYIEFVAKDTNTSGTPSFTIYGHKTANPTTFTTADNSVTGRLASANRTSASVNWSATAWTAESSYPTSNIKTIVQELVNQTDWAVGNSMVFLLDGSDSKRNPYSWDGSKGKAPKLVIEFIDDGSVSLDPTARDALIDIVDSLSPGGYTPLQDIMYEAALYYRGNDVDHGLKRGGPNDSGPFAYTRVSSELAIEPSTYTLNRPSTCSANNLDADACKTETLNTGAKYIAPIIDECSANYTVLLTDGFSNRPHSEAKIKTMTGATSCVDATGSGDACVPELTNYLYTKDQASNLNGDQTIITHTIGFNISNDWLKRVASSGGGNFYEVEKGDDLSKAFTEITVKALDDESTLVAPVAAVNAFNRVFTRDEIYYSIFKPSDDPHWAGNLKRYQLNNDLKIMDNSIPPQEAVDSDGKFKVSSTSFWSDVVDGSDVGKGGAAGEISDYSTRTIYTYTGNYSGTLSLSAFSSSNTGLTGSSLFNPIASGLTTSQLIDWSRGADIADIDGDAITNETRTGMLDGTEPRKGSAVMGDPLHSRPLAITYGGTEAAPDITIFMSTNAGFLHAFDADDGKEVFSFIPQELLPNLDKMYTNQGGEHIYGLDSAMTSWVIDKDLDGQIESVSGDKVYVFFGMRRGGSNYYAMDMTDRAAPKLMWVIKGGSGNFVEMGESWAQPLRVKLRYNNGSSVVTKSVLVLTGGYDNGQDSNVLTHTDSKGNAIFIVDALTGSLIWKGTTGASSGANKQFSEMKYSIPASPAGLDTNSNDIIDQLYVGDVGGQVWRFDIIEGATVSNLVKGGVIASVGDADDTTPEAIDSRRFYHTPEIGLASDSNGQAFAAIYIGSGWRENPLNTQIQDRFYMIKQSSVFKAPTSYTKIITTGLYNATDDKAGSTDASVRATAVNDIKAAQGWYFDLNGPGEKTLSSPLLFGGTVYFNTFEPTPTIVGCQAEPGTNRGYAVSALTATGTVEWGTAEAPGTEGRAGLLGGFGSGGDPTVSVRKMDDGTAQPLTNQESTKYIKLPKSLRDDDKSTFWIEQ